MADPLDAFISVREAVKSRVQQQATLGHQPRGDVLCAVMSPNGHFFATGDSQGAVRIFTSAAWPDGCNLAELAFWPAWRSARPQPVATLEQCQLV